MPWMIQEDQLDAQQRGFINEESRNQGNIWIQGFAGSGKSVLLVHQIRDLLRPEREPNANICIVVYTRALVDLFRSGIAELHLPKNVPVMTYYQFMDSVNHYDYIFCDEVQDLPENVLIAMKSRAGKVIVAGDSNQSIYQTDPKWKKPVVNSEQVGGILEAVPFRLNTIHRLTISIIRAVNSLLPNMNIWGAYRDPYRRDVTISLCESSTELQEVKYIYEKAKEYPARTAGQEVSVILLPTHEKIKEFFKLLLLAFNKPEWTEITTPFGPDYNALNTYLKGHSLNIQYVANGFGSLQKAVENQDVILTTYHSSKGLDFDHVFLPFVNSSLYISPFKPDILFMVAMTRSRSNLYLSYTGLTHRFVDKFVDLDCVVKIDIDELLAGNTTITGEIDDFDY